MTENGYEHGGGAVRSERPPAGTVRTGVPVAGHRVPEEWNQTARAYTTDACIHHLVEAQVRRTPGAVAVVADDVQLTYAELDDTADRLAALLRSGGARPGSFVALWMEHCADAVVALLGILKSGAAYVPIDPAWPAARQRHILRSLEVTAVVTRSTQYRRVFDLEWELADLRTVVCLDAAGDPPPEPVDEAAVRRLWDLVVGEAGDGRDAAGFRRTEDGSPFTWDEVLQYRDHVVALAAELAGPASRVLEMGCGSGLVMRALAPGVASYVGVDPSPAAQDRNARWVAESGAPVALATAFAHDDEALDGGPFDLVLAASTVQFFPGPCYLRRFLRRAAAACAPGGHVLLADVIDPELVEQRFGAAVSRAKRDTELHLHPAQVAEVVAGLDEISGFEVRRRDGFGNELACRYDVILTVGEGGAGAGARRGRLRTAGDLCSQPPPAPAADAAPGDLAYVIFTSGSTGDPKGVMVQHRPVVNLVEWVNTTFSVGPDDRLLLVTSFCFDLSVYDVFGILAAGGSIRVVADEDLREPRRLLELLCTEGITFWDSAPAALHQVMQFAGRERAGFGPDRLRLVFLSGDWVPVTLPDQIRGHFPAATVVALGGATEATIWSNWFVVHEVDPEWPSIPYGRPIQNARYHVLDDDMAQLPIGEAGDLYIGGECLALGYAGDPDLTASKFVPDPFSAEAGARLYRTGDRARWWPDGNMEFLGRVDSQVKVRGFRVELGEIEVALCRLPAVEVAVVVAHPGTGGDLQLDAYVILHAGTDASAHSLRSHLAALVPEYMVPQTFTILAELPLSRTGKVDRKGLPLPAGPTGSRSAGRPADELEALIAGVWTEILRVDDIGPADNFFDLGGQSLAAARVVAKLSELLPVSLPLRAVFDHPTLEALAGAVRAGLGDDGGGRVPVVEDRSAVPLSFLQEQMWEMERNMPGGAWNESFHHRLPEPLDRTALERALAHLVRRHEGLRTVFVADGDEQVQRILPDACLELRLLDRTAVAAEDRDDELAAVMEADNEVPFDAGVAPLLRALLVDFGGGRTELVLTFDHLIVDRTSVDILLTELDDAYAAFVAGTEPPPPPSDVQYADFAAWERAAVGPERLARRLEHWRRRLDGMPLTLDLPFDRVPEHRGAETSFVAFVVPPEVHASLKRLAVVSKASLFVLSVAAVKVLLVRRTGHTDVVVGTQVSARDRPELEGTVGLFTGPALLRSDLSGDPTFETVVRRVRDAVQELFEHQPFPYSRIRQELAPEVRRQRIPYWRAVDPVDVEFFYTHPERWSPGVNIVAEPPAGRYPTSDDRAEYSQPLEFTLFTDGEQLWGKATYPVDLFDVPTVDGLVDELQHILACAAAYWSSRIGCIPPKGSSD